MIKCPSCPKTFKNDFSLKWHMKKVGPDHKNKNKDKKTPHRTEKPGPIPRAVEGRVASEARPSPPRPSALPPTQVPSVSQPVPAKAPSETAPITVPEPVTVSKSVTVPIVAPPASVPKSVPIIPKKVPIIPRKSTVPGMDNINQKPSLIPRRQAVPLAQPDIAKKVESARAKKRREDEKQRMGLSRYGMLAYSHLGRFKDAPIVSHSTIFLPKSNEVTEPAPKPVLKPAPKAPTAPPSAVPSVPSVPPTAPTVPAASAVPSVPSVPSAVPSAVPSVVVPRARPLPIKPVVPVVPVVPKLRPLKPPSTLPVARLSSSGTGSGPGSGTGSGSGSGSEPGSGSEVKVAKEESIVETAEARDLRHILEQELGAKLNPRPYVLDFYKEYDDGLVRVVRHIVSRSYFGAEDLSRVTKAFLLALETEGEAHFLEYVRVVFVMNRCNWNIFRNKNSKNISVWTESGWLEKKYADLWTDLVKSYIQLIEASYRRFPENWDTVKQFLKDMGRERFEGSLQQLLKQISTGIETDTVIDEYRKVEVEYTLA